MAIANLFKSRASVMGYVFRSGKGVHFLDHNYTTTSEAEIAELNEEVKNGHPDIYIDTDMVTVDTDQLSPMAVLRAKIAEEERAKIMAAIRAGNDMGSTQAGRLEGIATSASIVGLQADSTSVAPAAAEPSTQVTSGVKVGAIAKK
jgi:hypothetical protein